MEVGSIDPTPFTEQKIKEFTNLKKNKMEKVFEMREVTVYLCEKDKMFYGTSSKDDVCAAIAAAGMVSILAGDADKADTLGKLGILVMDGKYKQLSEEELQKRQSEDSSAKSEDSSKQTEDEMLELILGIITKAWKQGMFGVVLRHAIDSDNRKWTDSFKEAEKKYLS